MQKADHTITRKSNFYHKMMNTRKTVSVTSFGQDISERIRMFGLPSPEHILMPILFVLPTRVLNHAKVMEFLRARKIMESVFHAGHLEPTRFGIESQIEPYLTIEINTLSILRKHIRSSTWRYNESYLTAGFADARKPMGAGTFRAISTAQIFHDIMYVRARSLDPAAHRPIQVSSLQAREFNLAVAGFYQAEVALWCRQLLTYHSAVLVMLRAAWMGRDPVPEYQRFLDRGGVYYLDYSDPCP